MPSADSSMCPSLVGILKTLVAIRSGPGVSNATTKFRYTIISSRSRTRSVNADFPKNAPDSPSEVEMQSDDEGCDEACDPPSEAEMPSDGEGCGQGCDPPSEVEMPSDEGECDEGCDEGERGEEGEGSGEFRGREETVGEPSPLQGDTEHKVDELPRESVYGRNLDESIPRVLFAFKPRNGKPLAFQLLAQKT